MGVSDGVGILRGRGAGEFAAGFTAERSGWALCGAAVVAGFGPAACSGRRAQRLASLSGDRSALGSGLLPGAERRVAGPADALGNFGAGERRVPCGGLADVAGVAAGEGPRRATAGGCVFASGAKRAGPAFVEGESVFPAAGGFGPSAGSGAGHCDGGGRSGKRAAADRRVKRKNAQAGAFYSGEHTNAFEIGRAHV